MKKEGDTRIESGDAATEIRQRSFGRKKGPKREKNPEGRPRDKKTAAKRVHWKNACGHRHTNAA